MNQTRLSKQLIVFRPILKITYSLKNGFEKETQQAAAKSTNEEGGRETEK